jgi:uncharacterized protein (TIGR03083 family)
MPWTTPSLTSLTQDECTSAIGAHSAGLAELAEGRLDAEVEYCPGWTVRDLVHHVTEVHGFWATVVEDRLTERPTQLEHPERADDAHAVGALRAAARRLVRVLSETDPATRVWTWAPHEQDAGFVVRHQVQEIVVHHWDAAHAVGRSVDVAPAVGADCVDEMLQHSVVNAANAGNPDDDPLPPALDGTFAVRCTDSDAAWVVADGPEPGLSAVTRVTGADVEERGPAAVVGTGGQLIRWLYARHGDPAGDADTSAVDAADPGLLERFRHLCFTD